MHIVDYALHDILPDDPKEAALFDEDILVLL